MPWNDIAFISSNSVGPPTGSNTTRAPCPPVISLISLAESSSSVAITYFAPASASCFRFALVRVNAIDLAPTELAIWIAASPALLYAPGMTTASSEVIFASSISAPYAVTNMIQIEAASTADSPLGCLTTA